MIQSANTKERHTIPRWNSIKLSNTENELESCFQSPRTNITVESNIEDLLDEWKSEHNIPLAVEILSEARLFYDGSNNQQIDDVLAYLSEKLQNNDDIPKLLLDFLRGESGEGTSIPAVSKKISTIRQSLIQYPRNPLLWCELSREYLTAGLYKKSELSIKTAIGLAPTHRLLLRAISRFYFHQGDYDKAKYYLIKAPNFKIDPWLLSAEIAISNESGRTSKYIKIGQRLLESQNYNPRSLSELGSELATVDFFSANSRQGKKKLEMIADSINENSAAQIIWLDEHTYKIPKIIEKMPSPQNNYESNAMLSYQKKDWQKAEEYSAEWQKYQPFSSKPVLMRSYVLSDFLQEYAQACSVLKSAIQCNSSSVELLNNYAYALIMVGRCDEAGEVIKRARAILKNIDDVALTATEGLLLYRQGYTEEGKHKYELALDMAKRMRNNKIQFELYLHLIREEIQAGNNVDHLLYTINNVKYHEFYDEFHDVMVHFGISNRLLL